MVNSNTKRAPAVFVEVFVTLKKFDRGFRRSFCHAKNLIPANTPARRMAISFRLASPNTSASRKQVFGGSPKFTRGVFLQHSLVHHTTTTMVSDCSSAGILSSASDIFRGSFSISYVTCTRPGFRALLSLSPSVKLLLIGQPYRRLSSLCYRTRIQKEG